MLKRKKLWLIVICAVLVMGLIWAVNYLGSVCIPSPAGCPDRSLKRSLVPQYKNLTSYGDGSGGYECSKPIRMVSHTVDKNKNPVNFTPVDPAEAKLFCHMTYAIEFEGKLKVLQKPEVLELISKYEYKDVSIKALEFGLIQDEEFVNRLLPTYVDKEIGCIIILETPNEKLVFLEDEDLETFELLDYKLFDKYLNNVSEADRNLFLGNLN